jgi:hypothetical protein
MVVCALAFAALVGGPRSAFAHDDEKVTTYGATACSVVAGLPVHTAAVCVKHSSEVDDGVTETTNHYVVAGTAATATAIQQYFVTMFQQQGWTLIKAKSDVVDQEWKYTVVQGTRRVKVEIEAQEPDEGSGTEITIEE